MLSAASKPRSTAGPTELSHPTLNLVLMEPPVLFHQFNPQGLTISQLHPLNVNLNLKGESFNQSNSQPSGFCSSPSGSVSPTSSVSSKSSSSSPVSKTGLPDLSDEELAQLSVRQLNLKLQVSHISTDTNYLILNNTTHFQFKKSCKVETV